MAPATQKPVTASPLPGTIIVGTPGANKVTVQGRIVILASIRPHRARSRRTLCRPSPPSRLGAVSVLDSSNRKPLRGGYWVVYAGPYNTLSEVSAASDTIHGPGSRRRTSGSSSCTRRRRRPRNTKRRKRRPRSRGPTMAEFAYDAINSQGLLTSGVISAPDVSSAREQLQSRGCSEAVSLRRRPHARTARQHVQEDQAEVAPGLRAPDRDDDRERRTLWSPRW